MMRTALALSLSLIATTGALANDSRFVTSASGKPELMVDGRPYLVLGIQLNNSSGFAPVFHDLADAIKRSHANTVMVPIGWESIEPEEGRFDWTVVDGIVREARAQNVRVALLWFGTWKNAKMSYVPAWVKRDTKRFPRVIDQNGHPIDVISPLSKEGMKADAQAFSALMAHLKTIDGSQRTVIMAQVENEAGTLGSDRDYSSEAQALYDDQVPSVMSASSTGTWSEVYGVRAPEAFMAYYTAKYIGNVAAAGKKAYDLPLYANVWPRQQPGLLRPGESSPSGGAVSWLLPQWRALAPAIDVIGVDNYDTNIAPYTEIAEAYDNASNPLFVPETGGSMAHARHAFWTIAQPYSVGISKFGIGHDFNLDDGKEGQDPIAVDYKLLEGAGPLLVPLRNKGEMRAAVEEDGLSNVPMAFPDVDIVARFGEIKDGYGGRRGQGTSDTSGRVLVTRLAKDRFLLTGASANLKFSPKLGDNGSIEIVSVEQGHYSAGKWVPEHLLNGDETAFGLWLPPEGRSLLVRIQNVH